MVLGGTAGATCVRISSLDSVRVATAVPSMRRSWLASVLRGRQEPGIRVWECSTDHCWQQRHTTDTLCSTCKAILCVHPAFHRPSMRTRSNGFFNRSTYSSVGQGCSLEWMLKKHQSTAACRVRTEGAKTCLLSAIWLPMTMSNESLTQYYNLVPTNTVLEGVASFFPAVYIAVSGVEWKTLHHPVG